MEMGEYIFLDYIHQAFGNQARAWTDASYRSGGRNFPARPMSRYYKKALHGTEYEPAAKLLRLCRGEKFFSSLKIEIVHHNSSKTQDEVRSANFEYEVVYNRQRRHQSLDCVNPIGYERSMDVT
jgi:integrase-like protein